MHSKTRYVSMQFVRPPVIARVHKDLTRKVYLQRTLHCSLLDPSYYSKGEPYFPKENRANRYVLFKVDIQQSSHTFWLKEPHKMGLKSHRNKFFVPQKQYNLKKHTLSITCKLGWGQKKTSIFCLLINYYENCLFE